MGVSQGSKETVSRARLATFICIAVVLSLAALAFLSSSRAEAAPALYLGKVFDGVTKTEDIPYGQAPIGGGRDQVLRLDLYQPTGDPAARRPAVIWVHGGGFGRGSNNNKKIVALSRTYARYGYVTAAIEYRELADPPCAPDNSSADQPRCEFAAYAAKADAQAAVRWLRANSENLRIDPSRIAMGGFSAGSITALLAGTLPESPGSSGTPGQRSDIRAVVSNCGGLPSNETITAGDAPTTFLYGSKDKTLPWARSNSNAFTAAGVPTAFKVFKGEGHCPNWNKTKKTVFKRSRSFLYEHLDLPLKARCDITLRGSNKGEKLTGTIFPDAIFAGGGSDRIRARRGDDCVTGGRGNDRISGGPGDDELKGSGGNDRVAGAAGNDALEGGAGPDRLFAGSGVDRVNAGSGADRVQSRDGNRDVIDCGPGKSDRARIDNDDFVSRCEKVFRARPAVPDRRG